MSDRGRTERALIVRRRFLDDREATAEGLLSILTFGEQAGSVQQALAQVEPVSRDAHTRSVTDAAIADAATTGAPDPRRLSAAWHRLTDGAHEGAGHSGPFYMPLGDAGGRW